MSGTERFKFNAKPGEPGFKEVTQNKYGHTVLQHNERTASELDDKVTLSLDPETGMPRADISIWDTQQMKELASKLNLPLDEDNDLIESEDSSVSHHVNGITDEDMDNLLQDITDDSSHVENEPLNLVLESKKTSNESRVRKVTLNSSDEPVNASVSHSKICSDTNCSAELPISAKFCSLCGKLQNNNLFCIECGRKYLEQEKFCSSCGCARQ